MAKLKDRKLYIKGILKLNSGGMVPQSPFTSAGLKQAGITALNNIKNPKTYTQFAKKLPMRTLGAMGLTNPYTLPIAGPAVMYSIADTFTPQPIKDRAELLREVRGPYVGIQDYDEVPDSPSTVDLLKEAKKLNLNSPLLNKLNKQYADEIKTDDRETGAELIDNGGSTTVVEKPTEIENKDPNDNNQSAQQKVYDQKKSIKTADKVFNKMEAEALKTPGKMTALQKAMAQAKEVMGEKGYNKSGRLLLLQLASNLLSGKSAQSGIPGFLDVLGQAGQNVIPMAIALEREREKDEMDLTKLLLESGKKQGKIKPPSMKIRFKLPNGELSDPLAASETDGGNYLVYDNINGESVRYTVAPDQIVGRAKIQDDKTIKAKLLQQYKTYKAGKMYTQTFLDIASKDPSLIGGSGGFKDLLYTFYEAQREATGGKDYRDTILKLTNEQRNLLGTDSDIDPEARKQFNSIFSEIETMTQNIDDVSEDIQKQSLLKTLQLLSTYSLAQTLKDKDRLAVQDIQNAKDRLDNIMRINPFKFRGDIDILSSYKAVGEQFDSRLADVRVQWDDQLFNPQELINIDQNYPGSKISKQQENLKNFTENFDADNNKDMDLFNKMFNEDNLKGIISE